MNVSFHQRSNSGPGWWSTRAHFRDYLSKFKSNCKIQEVKVSLIVICYCKRSITGLQAAAFSTYTKWIVKLWCCSMTKPGSGESVWDVQQHESPQEGWPAFFLINYNLFFPLKIDDKSIKIKSARSLLQFSSKKIYEIGRKAKAKENGIRKVGEDMSF